jgi:hypothetical protein
LNLTFAPLTDADDYSAKEHRLFYRHDTGSLSLYAALLRLAFANFNGVV